MPEDHVATDPATGRRIVRCFIYARISEDREGAGLATERQTDDCYELAARLSNRDTEYRVVHVYEDNDLSAYTGKPRPDYIAMLDRLRAGDADCVLAWHTDRIHRSPAELEEYIDVCQPRRIDTRTVKAGDLDLTTATGRMIARQLGVQARYEVERMIERQRRKRDQMAEHGEYFGGRRPFGYEPDGITPRSLLCPKCGADAPNQFTSVRLCAECGPAGNYRTGRGCQACRGSAFTVECFCSCGAIAELAPGSEAALIDEAADAILAGASLRGYAAQWTARGVRTSTGKDFRGEELRDVLMRPRNAGLVKHRGEVVGQAGWKALLPEEKWRSLVAYLSDESRRITSGPGRRYLGSGLYLCGEHGVTMRSATQNREGPARWIYTCRLRKHLTRRMQPLDDYVQMMVLERLSRPDAAELLVNREQPVDVAGARRDMREARATLDQLATALGSGEMDMLEWRAASSAAKRRLASAEEVLASAVKANPVAGLVGAGDLEAAWNALDLGRQRAVISHLMTVTVLPARRGRIPGGGYWDPDGVRIDWK